MSIWELFLTAVALSMDAMAVAVSVGLSNAGGKGVKFREAGLMGLFFGVFQAVMPLLGYYIIPLLAMIFGSGVTRFVEGTDHWIAFVLLVFLGGKMIIEAVRAEEEAEPSNPFALGTLFVMAIATSIDALATGIVFRSFSFSTGKLLLAVGFIGSVTFILTLLGALGGKKLGEKFRKRAEIIGGIFLVCIGAKILIEHLFF